jgi:luciferase family oxidoreductase group 1
LLAWFSGDREQLPIRRVLPGLPHVPKVWLLGSSPASGAWAANYGLPYVFADFIAGRNAPIASYYRANFKPGALQPEPHVTVAVWTIAADTDDEAKRLASSFQMMMTLLHRGHLIAVPPPEKAMRFLEEEGLAPGELPPGRRAIIGSPQTVRAGLEAVAAEYQADEMMLVNILYDHAARKRSYELVARAWGI